MAARDDGRGVSTEMRGIWRIRRAASAIGETAARWQAERKVSRFPRVAGRRPHGLGVPLVVTLTSYGPRFPTLALTLKCLLDQTVAADHTVLWIARDELADLPAEVRALEAHGLEIRTCGNLRSFKKLVPAFATFPGATLVTADDDVFYPEDWLEALVREARLHPATVIAWRAHRPQFASDGRLLPYRVWQSNTRAREESPDGGQPGLLFPTGVGGVLYPPGALDPGVTDEATFERLCPHADDVWFFWMTQRTGTPRRRPPGQFRVVEWKGSKEVALYHANWLGDRNDVQIAAMEAHFGPILAQSPGARAA